MRAISAGASELPVNVAPLSTGALAIGLAGVGATAIWAARADDAVIAMFAVPAILCGAGAALLERSKRNALGSALLLVATLLLIRFCENEQDVGIALALLVCLPVTPYVLLPAVVAWLAHRRGCAVYKCFLALWLVSAATFLIYPVGELILMDGHTPIYHRPVGLVLWKFVMYQFGPWATPIARTTTYMNVGEGLGFLISLFLTALLGAAISAMLRWPHRAMYWYVPFAWLLALWFTLGTFPYLSDLASTFT